MRYNIIIPIETNDAQSAKLAICKLIADWLAELQTSSKEEALEWLKLHVKLIRE